MDTNLCLKNNTDWVINICLVSWGISYRGVLVLGLLSKPELKFWRNSNLNLREMWWWEPLRMTTAGNKVSCNFFPSTLSRKQFFVIINLYPSYRTIMHYFLSEMIHSSTLKLLTDHHVTSWDTLSKGLSKHPNRK